MPNLSLAMFTSGTSDASIGDVAITNPSTSLIQEAVTGTAATWGTATLEPGEESQGHLVTNPVYDMPPEAAPVGLLAQVHCYSFTSNNGLTEAAFRFMLAGSPIGSDGAGGGRTVGKSSDAAANVLLYGGRNALLGTTPTLANVLASTWGHRFQATNPTGSQDVLRNGFMDQAVYWEGTIACRLTRTSPLSVEVGHQIGVHARHSIIGTRDPEHVLIRYALTSYPGGYTPRTYANPIPGDPGGATLSEATAGRGWYWAIRPTVAGTYTVRAEMFVRDGTTWKRCQSNIVTFTATASTRTLRYLNPSTGNDANSGVSAGAAWATLAPAHTALNGKRGWEFVLADDTTLNMTATGPNFQNLTNVIVRRSADGAAKPIISMNASANAWQFGSATDLVFVGITVVGNSGSGLINEQTNFLHSPSSINRLSLIDCTGTAVQSMIEGNNLCCVLLQGCTLTNFSRYGSYLGSSDDAKPTGMFCAWGVSLTTSDQETGEGGFRFNNITTTRLWAQCATFNFCAFDANGTDHSAIRRGWSFCFMNRCSFLGNTVGASHPPTGSASRGPAEWACTFHGCYVETANFNAFSRQGHHVCFSHCIIKSTAQIAGRAGFIYRYSMVNCLFIVPDGSADIAVLDTANLTDLYFVGIHLSGCVQVYEEALATVTAIPLVRNTTAVTLFDETAAWAYCSIAKAVAQRDANVSLADATAVNATAAAIGFEVLAIEGSDIDEGAGWTAAGLDTLPNVAAFFAEDARGILHDPADTDWNRGAVGLTSDDTAARLNFTNATPGDPSYVAAWPYASSFDPGSAATEISGGGGSGGGGSVGSQTVVVPSGVTTNWAECRGDDTAAGANATTGGTLRATGNTSTAGSRACAVRFEITTAVPAGSTIDVAALRVDPINTSSDDGNFDVYGINEDNVATFNTTTRNPLQLTRTTATLQVAQDAIASGGGYFEINVAAILQELLDDTVDGWAVGEYIGIVLVGRSNLPGSKVFSIGLPTSPNNDPEVVIEWTEPAQGGSRLDRLRSRMRRVVGAAIRLLTDGIS